MTRKQSQRFRILLFVCGLGIIALAFFLITANKELTRKDVFTWISITVMYCVFFTPFFFSSIRISNFSDKIPSLPLVWTGISLYIIISIVLIILLGVGFPFKAIIIIQAVILFLFMIDVYFAYFASSHAGRVGIEEATTRQYLTEIKTKAQLLSLTVNNLPAEYENAQKILKKTLEDIKYISPVEIGTADELELQIIVAIKSISEKCALIDENSHPSGLLQEAQNLQNLINMRKLLRN